MGDSPDQIGQELLDKLSAYALRPAELGVPEEVEYGWSGGRHLLDGEFTFENNVFADAVHFALRIDTNKVPGELKRALSIMEEEAAAATNPSGFISKEQKRQARETVRQKIEEELRSGRFRRSKLLPILWDVAGGMLFCSAAGAALEQLMDLFERTFGLSLMPLSAGALALRYLESKGRRRDYEDLRPTRFISVAEGDAPPPEYPWVLKGPEPKDFLGNEFLLWLWHESEMNQGELGTDGKAAVMFEKSLELECAFGQTGKDSFRSMAPTHMVEAREGLLTGKVPRKAGLVVDVSGIESRLTFQCESFAATGAKLAEVEDAATPRVLFEERIALLKNACKAIDSIYEGFLSLRVGGGWESKKEKLRRWVNSSVKIGKLSVV